jgi:hypothetical protein
MPTLMRPNPVRANLQAGGNVYGTMAFEFFSPGLMTILAEAGADFVLLDTEHSGVGIERTTWLAHRHRRMIHRTPRPAEGLAVRHTTENGQGDQSEPARRPARASGAAEMSRNLFRYVLATSGLHQLFLLLLTVGVFLLEVVPLELQRRIVNDLVKHRDFWLVIVLCAVYAGTVLGQGGAPSSSLTSIAAGRRARNPRAPSTGSCPG